MAGGGEQGAVTNPELSRVSAEWATALEGIVAELGEIARSTEDEFLLIGGRLQDFYQRGSGISTLATAMVGEVAGDRVTEAMTELSSMLELMACYVDGARSGIADSSATLRETLALLETVAEPLSGFKKVNKVLRMLGISTKIESARLGRRAAGFVSLASDVGELSVQVNEKAAIILKRRDDLALAIRQGLSGVVDAGVRQHDRVVAILDKTRHCLETLMVINGRCSGSVAEVSAMSDEVARSVGEVVMSMQAHDMVRQQIEHVEQALDELRDGLASGVAGAEDAACICELQVAQLRHASSAFDGAVRTIIDSLQDVANKQSALAARTRGMAGIADQTGEGFFSGMEKDLAVVCATLVASSQVNGNLGAAMRSVAETVEEIAVFVGDIERIGEEIKLIALNAQIKSASTGEEGAALGVLAEAIQRLSVDAIDQTAAVSGILQSILGVTERLRASEAGAAHAEEVSGMVGTLSTLLEVLRGVNGTLRHALLEMESTVTHLSDEIEQVTAGISVHHHVAAVLERALHGLSGILEQARRLLPVAPVGTRQLDTLAHRYTMESERVVHKSLLHHSKAGLPSPANAPCLDDELGANVELF